MNRTLVILALTLLYWPAAAGARVWVVRPDGTGSFPTIQNAIDGCANGDTIALTNGVFSGDGNRNIDFRGRIVCLRSQSGHVHDCVIDCGGAYRGLYFHVGEPPATVVRDITIANAYNTSGGGMYAIGASPTLQNCVFENCNALYGGAIYT
jgi:hypothetical protein